MKLTFFYQHFWPDSPPYANMLRSMTAHFVSKGYDVNMLTATPAYKAIDRSSSVASKEKIDGVYVTRLSLLPGSNKISLIRAASKALWPMRAALYLVVRSLFGEKPDVVVAATIPPVANGLFGILSAKLVGAKFIYHMQDIYPEIAEVGGIWAKDGIKYRLLKRIDTWICKKADVCIALSADMAHSLVQRGVRVDDIAIINNFMLSSFGDEGALDVRTPESNNDKIRLVFAGNLGRFQGLEKMVAAFVSLQTEAHGLELHFVGEGKAELAIREVAKNSTNIFFHGHLPFEEAAKKIQTFDAGIVSIQPDIYRFAYPSKTLTYIGLGLPVLAFVESESALSSVIDEHGLGTSASGTSEESLMSGFRAIKKFCQEEPNASDRVQEYASKYTTFSAVMNQWEDMLGALKRN